MTVGTVLTDPFFRIVGQDLSDGRALWLFVILTENMTTRISINASK